MCSKVCKVHGKTSQVEQSSNPDLPLPNHQLKQCIKGACHCIFSLLLPTSVTVATFPVTWLALPLARSMHPPADASAKITSQSVHPKWPCKPDRGAKSSAYLLIFKELHWKTLGNYSHIFGKRKHVWIAPFGLHRSHLHLDSSLDTYCL